MALALKTRQSDYRSENPGLAAWAASERLAASGRSTDHASSLLQRALQLLRADLAAWSIWGRRGQRLIAAASRDRAWSEWRSLLCRLPSELAADLIARGQPMILPEDVPQHPIAALLTRATVAAIHIPVANGGGPQHMIHLVRFTAPPSSVRERAVACRIAIRASAVSATIPWTLA